MTEPERRPPVPPAAGPSREPLAAARDRLASLDELPVSEHAEVYAVVQALLGEALSDIDVNP